MRKLTMTVDVLGTYKINQYNKPITLQFGLCRGNPSTQKDIMTVVFPANHLVNVLTNKTKRHRKIHNSIQLNKPKQLNTINLILIWSLIWPSVRWDDDFRGTTVQGNLTPKKSGRATPTPSPIPYSPFILPPSLTSGCRAIWQGGVPLRLNLLRYKTTTQYQKLASLLMYS